MWLIHGAYEDFQIMSVVTSLQQGVSKTKQKIHLFSSKYIESTTWVDEIKKLVCSGGLRRRLSIEEELRVVATTPGSKVSESFSLIPLTVTTPSGVKRSPSTNKVK